MASETGTSPTTLGLIQRIAQSPFGPLFFEVLGEMASARDAEGNKPLLQRPKRSWQEVLSLLTEEAKSIDLFAAMRLIECIRTDLPRLGTSKRKNEDPVKFGQHVSLSYATSTIYEFVPANGNTPPQLLQLAFGLFGPNGPMPNHLTEYVYEREHHHADHTFARFADIFNHRALTLFYRAWANSQPVVGLDRSGQDAFGNYVATICGLGMPALRNRDNVEDTAKFAHAGLFSRQVRNAEGLQALLENYFNVDVQLLSWVGYWMSVPKTQQSRLGQQNGFSLLGISAIAGERVWDVQTAFRIVVGPLTHKRYLDFLPNGESQIKLRSLVKLYAGEEYQFDIQLILQNNEVPLSWLGNDVKLGWTSWLGVRLETSDAYDYLAR